MGPTNSIKRHTTTKSSIANQAADQYKYLMVFLFAWQQISAVAISCVGCGEFAGVMYPVHVFMQALSNINSITTRSMFCMEKSLLQGH